MLNKELLLASQEVVAPDDFMKHSWFEIELKPSVTRATGSNIFLLSFHTPNGIALDKFEFARSAQDNLFIHVEEFKNIPFDLSEMEGYSYYSFSDVHSTELHITFEGVNSGIVTYEDVWLKFDPGVIYFETGTYVYYPN